MKIKFSIHARGSYGERTLKVDEDLDFALEMLKKAVLDNRTTEAELYVTKEQEL